MNRKELIETIWSDILTVWDHMSSKERQSMGLFFKLFTNDSGVIISINGIVEYCNPQVCLLMGLSMSELIGRRITDFYANQACIDEINKRTDSCDESVYSIEYVTKDGKIIDLQCKALHGFYNGRLGRFTVVNQL